MQREYHNVRTGEKVRLWLIVGHAREVSAHTPDICYPSQGFEARASENSVYPMVFPDQPKTDFLTNTFLRENTSRITARTRFLELVQPDEQGE